MPLLFLLLGLRFFIFAEESLLVDEQFADTGRIQPLFRNGKYINPFPIDSSKISPKQNRNIRRKLFGPKAANPSRPLPSQQVNISQALPEDLNGLYVTWLGHSSVLMQIDGIRLLLDPMLSNNVSPVPLARNVPRFQKGAPIEIDSLPFIDAVFISHNHLDHMNPESILALAPKTGYFMVPIGVSAYLKRWGVNSEKIREYSWWQEGVLQGLSGKYLRFVCTPSRHKSQRSLFDLNKTLWASWVFIGSEHRVFFSGDTGYNLHFKQIGHHFGPFDLTIIENGQYNLAWPFSHLFPEEGVQAHLDLRGKNMLPVHWGSFGFSAHDWQEPPERVLHAAETQGVLLRMPRIGQTFSIDDPPAIDPWWRE
ncbi:MAG: MBL fold metallo-hydrolase [Fibromonadaceae bacterium]|jgi:L-ascorbate metabolism protein UlaG (beta-lactamase superfamily)|nr:MBL fold metallo-hydrolase [Fibromonadaceae bacterium]